MLRSDGIVEPSELGIVTVLSKLVTEEPHKQPAEVCVQRAVGGQRTVVNKTSIVNTQKAISS